MRHIVHDFALLIIIVTGLCSAVATRAYLVRITSRLAKSVLQPLRSMPPMNHMHSSVESVDNTSVHALSATTNSL